MNIISVYSNRYGSNCYLALDDTMQNAVVIDPSAPVEAAVSTLGFLPRVQAILLTHGHADHFLSLRDWKEKTGAPVLIGKADAYALGNPDANCATLLGLGDFRQPEPDGMLSDGDEIALGSESLSVISTPGHSCGSVCYYAKGHLFSGDTIFADGGVGRSDLFGGDEAVLYSSIGELLTLPSETVVYPGHGPRTTIGEQKPFHSYFI